MQLKFYDAPNYSKYINWIEEDIKGSSEDFASHKFEWQNRPEITSAVKKKVRPLTHKNLVDQLKI
jgi:hypothetical protein